MFSPWALADDVSLNEHIKNGARSTNALVAI